MSANTVPTPQATKAVTRPRTSDVITPVGFMPDSLNSDVMPQIVGLNLGFFIFNLAATCKEWRCKLADTQTPQYQRVKNFVWMQSRDPESALMQGGRVSPFPRLSQRSSGDHNLCLKLLRNTGCDWTNGFYTGMHNSLVQLLSYDVTDWDRVDAGAKLMVKLDELDFDTLYPSAIPPGPEEYFNNRTTTLFGDAVMSANHKMVEAMLKLGNAVCNPHFFWNSELPNGNAERVNAYSLAIRAREVTRKAIDADPDPGSWSPNSLANHDAIIDMLEKRLCHEMWVGPFVMSAVNDYIEQCEPERRAHVDWKDMKRRVALQVGRQLNELYHVTGHDLGRGDGTTGAHKLNKLIEKTGRHSISVYKKRATD